MNIKDLVKPTNEGLQKEYAKEIALFRYYDATDCLNSWRNERKERESCNIRINNVKKEAEYRDYKLQYIP